MSGISAAETSLSRPGPGPAAIRWAVAVTIALASLAVTLSVSSANQLLAIVLTFIGLTLLLFSHRVALTYGLLWLFSKGFWLRVAFHSDVTAGRPTTDWLGPAPTVFLGIVAALSLYQYISLRQESKDPPPLRWLVIFGGFAVLTLLIPTGSLWVKLAGLQRNIFPTLAMAFTAVVALRHPDDWRKLCRTLLVFASVSIAYAIAQHIWGLPVWERTWFSYLYASRPQGLTGWLTVGPEGIEFRVFSCYYSYTEFFFTTVGIGLLYLAILRGKDTRPGRVLFATFVLLFATLLVLTLERMPIVMLLCGGLTIWSFSAGRVNLRKRILAALAIAVGIWSVAALTLTAYLGSGVDKLERVAELANPLAATSIQERLADSWSTSLANILERPWGWGLGYGSQTMASSAAARSGAYVKPHNEILQKAVELGLAGALLFALLLISQWRFVWRGLFSGSTPDSHRLHFQSYAALMVAYLVCGLVNLTFSGTMGMLFWLATGFTWTLRCREDVGPLVTRTP